MNPVTYSVKDVVSLLGVGRTTIYKLINDGRLNPIKIGARTLIPASEVDALLSPNPA